MYPYPPCAEAVATRAATRARDIKLDLAMVLVLVLLWLEFFGALIEVVLNERRRKR